MFTDINFEEKTFTVNPAIFAEACNLASVEGTLESIFRAPELSAFNALRAHRGETLFCLADLRRGKFTFLDAVEGDFRLLFVHERMVCIAPNNEFRACAVSGVVYHELDLVTVYDTDETAYEVWKGYSSRHLFCTHCGEFLPAKKGGSVVVDGLRYCGEDCLKNAGFVRCSWCDDWHSADEMEEHDGEKFCPGCFRSLYATCGHCGEVFRRADGGTVFAYGENFCCSECAMEGGYVACEGCGEWLPFSDAYLMNGNFYCGSCADDFHVCDNCGDRFPADNGYTAHGEHYCSKDCAIECGHPVCADCGDLIDYEIDDEDGFHHVYENAQGEEICPSCARQSSYEGRRVLRGYSDNPSLDFHHTEEDEKGKRLYEGFEIEFFIKNPELFNVALPELVKKYQEKQNIIFFKHDGSVGYYGAEAVSMPCTLAYIKKNAGIFKEFFTILEGYGMEPHEHCGMHVHLSRAGMTEEHEIKMELFFSNHYQIVEKIAGRAPGAYCHRILHDIGADIPRAIRYSSRYRSLNWNNDKTVEIRAFKCPVTFAGFMVKMEAAHCFYQFTKSASLDDIETKDPALFVEFVNQNVAKYPFLAEFIAN